MDEQTLQGIKTKLLSSWDRLLQSAQHEIHAAKETDESQAEIIDIAQAMEQLGRDSSLKEQERRELAAVERALTKLASGIYGICEDCEEEIPQGRLLVVPSARLCAECQTVAEIHSQRVARFASA